MLTRHLSLARHMSSLLLILSVKVVGSTIAQFVRSASYPTIVPIGPVGEDRCQSILFEIEPLAHFPEMMVRKSVWSWSFVSRHHWVMGRSVLRS
jgi:hypothetical protein